MTDTGEILIYQTKDGQTRVRTVPRHHTLWLAQAQLAMLHIQAIYGEEELVPAATCKDCLQVERLEHTIVSDFDRTVKNRPC